MTNIGNHGIVSVAFALAGASGMNVHVCDNHQVCLAALLPNRTELLAVEFDDAVREAVWIDIVVKEKLPNSADSAVSSSKEKCSTFAPSSRPVSEFVNTLIPHSRAADYPRPPAGCCVQQRSK